MPKTSNPPQFNLWSVPWITVETETGELVLVSIEQLLRRAAAYRSVFDPSPLVVVGIHRLLTAILQDVLQPQYDEELLDLWEQDAFPDAAITRFGQEYAQRFDLFSADMPFLQSADIALHPQKRGKGKSVGYLLQEQTAGTAVTHYTHIYDESQMLCAACCAKGLLTIPAFASSGGAGIRPSINGVPPIYVIPGGDTCYHSLVASLVTPPYQPTVADRERDTPWWRHDPIVQKKRELLRVGYLHSLTFPARRVRLHPEPMRVPCSRCGQTTAWGATEMVYEMGESRPKDAAFWRDPFAAYRVNDGKEPRPIRPYEGRAAWREFAGLFLPQAEQRALYRPAVISQLEALGDELPYGDTAPIPFQTVGLRTDGKMKIFEWERSGFLVPSSVLSDPLTGQRVASGLEFATKCAAIIDRTFRDYFGGDGKSERHLALRKRLAQAYWEQLAPIFSEFILALGATKELDEPFHQWLDSVQSTAMKQFDIFAALVGRDAVSLRKRVEAVSHNRARLYKLRRDNFPKEVNA